MKRRLYVEFFYPAVVKKTQGDNGEQYTKQHTKTGKPGNRFKEINHAVIYIVECIAAYIRKPQSG